MDAKLQDIVDRLEKELDWVHARAKVVSNAIVAVRAIAEFDCETTPVPPGCMAFDLTTIKPEVKDFEMTTEEVQGDTDEGPNLVDIPIAEAVNELLSSDRAKAFNKGRNAPLSGGGKFPAIRRVDGIWAILKTAGKPVTIKTLVETLAERGYPLPSSYEMACKSVQATVIQNRHLFSKVAPATYTLVNPYKAEAVRERPKPAPTKTRTRIIADILKGWSVSLTVEEIYHRLKDIGAPLPDTYQAAYDSVRSTLRKNPKLFRKTTSKTGRTSYSLAKTV